MPIAETIIRPIKEKIRELHEKPSQSIRVELDCADEEKRQVAIPFEELQNGGSLISVNVNIINSSKGNTHYSIDFSRTDAGVEIRRLKSADHHSTRLYDETGETIKQTGSSVKNLQLGFNQGWHVNGLSKPDVDFELTTGENSEQILVISGQK